MHRSFALSAACLVTAIAWGEETPGRLLARVDGARGQDGLPAGWRHVILPSVDVPSRFTLEPRDGVPLAIHAVSEKAASFLAWQVPKDVDLAKTPWLTWRWRALAVPPGDGRSKEGDDFGARVCVGFETDWSKEDFLARVSASRARDRWGQEPPGTSLHYVWAGSGRTKNDSFDEPYQPERVKCIAAQTGGPSGAWVDEARDVLADYKRLFKKEPPRAIVVALMSDSDDTGTRAEALYAEIAFVSTRP